MKKIFYFFGRIQSSIAHNPWLILVVILGFQQPNGSSWGFGANPSFPIKLMSVQEMGSHQCSIGSPNFNPTHWLFHDQSRSRQSVQEVNEIVTQDGFVAEMIIQDKRFLRKNNRWYLESRGRLYEIITDSLTIRFKPQTSIKARQNFLEFYHLMTIRKNRLDIYDVKILSKNNALELFSDLQEHPLIDYVDLNTLGEYEDN